jgi:hypothetical protein
MRWNFSFFSASSLSPRLLFSPITTGLISAARSELAKILRTVCFSPQILHVNFPSFRRWLAWKRKQLKQQSATYSGIFYSI